MKLHSDPEQASWDRRIIKEATQHYSYDDVFNWRHMHTVIDVGSHIGAFANWLFSTNTMVDLVCVEADRENYDLAVCNRPPSPNVRLLWGAVTYVTQPLVMERFHEAANSGSHRLVAASHGSGVYDGPLYTLERITELNGWQTIDALKLDCEGCEYDILAHADLGLLRTCQVIVGEYHDGPDRFRRECVQRLRDDFDVVYLNTCAPLGGFCLVNKEYSPCG